MKRRPTACIPCNERKVQCDASAVGTPCNRCASKGRAHECYLIPPRQSKRSRTSRSQERSPKRFESRIQGSRGDNLNTTSAPTAHTEQAPNQNLENNGYRNGRAGAASHAAQPLSPPTGRLMTEVSTETPYALSEEDGHVQTLHRMTDGVNPTSIHGNEPRNQEVVEYYGKLNSLSILGQVLGHTQQRRLIQLDIPGPSSASSRQRELAYVTTSDRSYLDSQRVFSKPPGAAW